MWRGAAQCTPLRRLVSRAVSSSSWARAQPGASARFASARPQVGADHPAVAARALLAVLLSAASCTSSAALLGRQKGMESADAVKAEELYNDKAYDRHALLDDLRAMHAARPEDVGVLWRLTRAAYDVANLKATPAAEKKELTYFARDVAQKGLDLAPEAPETHKWFGITLSSIGDYEGSKVSIANSYVIKGHWDKAIELNPNDATTYYLLGRWCIAIADLSWLERKAAAVLFGAPPESSYQEALGFLLQSEALAPDSWKKRTLLIAQVHQKMKDYAAAKKWAGKALAIPVETEEDETVQEEAAALLKKL